MKTLLSLIVLSATFVANVQYGRAEAESAFIASRSQDPVDWQSWTEELLERSVQNQKPLFFFVGHFGNSLARSMGTETFSNPMIAELINETTIPVLVEVNQQPELASFLLQLAAENFQANEWPVCIWTTSKLAPINGGGYLPPTDDWGREGFLTIARNVSERWGKELEEVESQASERLGVSVATMDVSAQPTDLSEAIKAASKPFAESQSLLAAQLAILTLALPSLPSEQADALRSSLEERVDTLLSGAGFDPVSGGFFIGANDPNWRIPLFQKSTADQALMLQSLARLHSLSPKPVYKDLMRLAFGYANTSLLKENGFFREYLDSYSVGDTRESTEGSFYLFGQSDIDSFSLEELAPFGLKPEGNLGPEIDILEMYGKQNIPYVATEDTLSASNDDKRNNLLQKRSQKSEPQSENVGYVSTNALLVQGLIEAYGATGEAPYLESAQSLFKSIMEQAFDKKKKILYNSDLRATFASSAAYAHCIAAALSLLESTDDSEYMDTAISIHRIWRNDSRFESSNCLELAIEGNELSLASYRDDSRPSTAGVYLGNLSKLAKLTGDSTFQDEKRAILSEAPQLLRKSPEKFLTFVVAAHGRSD